LVLNLPNGRTTEFCSILNRILRDLDEVLLPSACIIVRGINALCVMRRDPLKLKYPPNGVSFRGGCLPPEHVVQVNGKPSPFFVKGKKYRVPMFLASSFKHHVAENFSVLAHHRKENPVIWSIKVDPRGQHELLHRCKHVNHLAKSNVDGEDEFLFAPYSVFTVESVALPDATRWYTSIVIVASLDNKEEPEDLPIAPWA
jgi:hypothetical protein